MKSTIIYEKKKITIGELLHKYNTNLIWFCILLLNLITNYYLNIYISITIDSNLCGNETNCGKRLELLSDKLYFSKKLICVGLLINLLVIFLNKKVISYLEIIFRKNSNNFFELISTIPVLLYILSSIIYKPMIIYLHYYNYKYKFDSQQENLTTGIIILYYLILEMFSFVLILLLVLFSLIFFFDYLYEIFNIFYKSNIKDIEFEYTESKFVDVEKNI